MKYKIILLLSIFFLNSSAYTQDSTLFNNNYEKDIIQRRDGIRFITPKNGINKTNPKLGIERDPTFRKCRKIESAEGRSKCFGKILYGHLRNTIEIDRRLDGNPAVELVIRFTISKTGEIKDIKFLKSNDKSGKYERKMISSINQLPRLEPGIKKGKPADIPFTFSMKFG